MVSNEYQIPCIIQVMEIRSTHDTGDESSTPSKECRHETLTMTITHLTSFSFTIKGIKVASHLKHFQSKLQVKLPRHDALSWVTT